MTSVKTSMGGPIFWVCLCTSILASPNWACPVRRPSVTTKPIRSLLFIFVGRCYNWAFSGEEHIRDEHGCSVSPSHLSLLALWVKWFPGVCFCVLGVFCFVVVSVVLASHTPFCIITARILVLLTRAVFSHATDICWPSELRASAAWAKKKMAIFSCEFTHKRRQA